MAGLQLQLSATVAAAAGVEVRDGRDGCQVSTTLGQHSIWRRAAALCVAAGSEAPVDNICHGGWTICPGPGVGGIISLLSGQKRDPSDLDLSSCAEADAKNAAKTESEPLRAGCCVSSMTLCQLQGD